MIVLGSKLGRGIVAVGGSAVLLASIFCTTAFAQNAQGPIDPYAAPAAAPPPPPAPPAQVAPPPPAPAPAPPAGNSGGNNNTTTVTANPTNTNTANPTNTNTANPTTTITANPTNTNTNDNRSSATVTNNNTIYIYPPTVTPPAPPPIAAPPGLVGSPSAGLLPPLVPPPAIAAPYHGQRIRLNCAQLCARPPAPVLPRYGSYPTAPVERVRFVSLGGHVTAFGMANQPLAGWGTLYGGGINLTFRSRGRFGFELSQDFLRGEMRNGDRGLALTRQSFPFQFSFRGYILPNSDRHHFNMYFGGGLGAMASRVEVPFGNGESNTQNFLEWMIHGDLGAELRFKWIALGLDGRVSAIVRDRNYGDAGYYRGIQDGPVPAATWGVEGRGYLNFWF